MNKIKMDVHPMEQKLLETLRNDIVFGTMEIKVENGLPVRGEASKAYDFRRMVERQKTGTEG